MKLPDQYLRFFGKTILTCICMSFAFLIHAEQVAPGTLQISNTPLFMGANIVPNFYIIMDDSESMDLEIMAQPHWARSAYDKNAVFTPTQTDIDFFEKNDCTPDDCNVKPLKTDTRVCCCNPDMNCSINKKDDGVIYLTLPDKDKIAYQNLMSSLGATDTTYRGSFMVSTPMYNLPFGFISYCRVSTKNPYLNCVNDVKKGDNIDQFTCYSTPSSVGFSFTNCPATEIQDWRVRSSNINTLFYNPKETYKPWPSIDGLDPDAKFDAARSNPYTGKPGYNLIMNLGDKSSYMGADPMSCRYDYANNKINCDSGGFVFNVWKDDKGFIQTDGHPRRGANINVTDESNGEVDLWDSHYKVIVTNGEIKVQLITCNPDKNTGDLNCCGESGSGIQPQCPAAVTGKDLGKLLPFLDIDRCANKNNCDPFEEEKKNIARWFQYSHRKSLVAKGGLAEFVNRRPHFRYAFDTLTHSFANNSNAPIISFPSEKNEPIVQDIFKLQQHSNNVIKEIYSVVKSTDIDVQGPGTPTRLAYDKAGKNYMSDPNAIVHACQRNFTILISDGYWENIDNMSGSLADIAAKYYQKDLRLDLPDIQATSKDDPKKIQHMVTYMFGFGVESNLPDKNPLDGWPDNVVTDSNDVWNNTCGSPCWGNPLSCTTLTCPEKINDMWHAAYNSHGRYYSVKSSSELIKKLQDVLDRALPDFSSSAATSVSQRFISSNSSIVVPGFSKNGNDWFGSLKSYKLEFTTDGKLSKSLDWDAGQKLNSNSARVIMTFNDQKGIPFQWKNFNDNQKNFLNKLWEGGELTSETGENKKGEARVEYLRGKGVATAEKDWVIQNKFRARSSKLGDIIYSDPVYVASSVLRYDESLDLAESYIKFKEDQNDRTPVIYVGANDGMLHGFNANTCATGADCGKELIAYVPNILFPNLTRLTSPDYTHLYYVDGAITVGDAFISRKWQTLLIGGLRAGGQAVYALDITDPNRFSEHNADKIVKWEFTDKDGKYGDRDLGYTFGKPLIIRTNSKQHEWVAIFGNGYNNTVQDLYPSQTGNAVLYIVDADTGELVKKMDTGVGYTDSRAKGLPNGLATPAAIDVGGDFKVDYIYAGDLLGNLWKFNISDSSTSRWNVAGNAPLFKAKNDNGDPQPITTRPYIYKNYTTGQGYMIYFGTGKFFEETNAMSENQPTQSFYAIWDKNPGKIATINRANLFKQQFISQTSGSVEYRRTNRGNIDWNSQLGWYLDFIMGSDNKGEKQASDILLNNKTLIFSTLLPQPPENTCEFGGSSWIYILNAADGGPPVDLTPDMDGDGTVSDQEKKNPPSAFRDQDIGVTGTPAIYKDGEDKTHVTVYGSTGRGIDIIFQGQLQRPRQTWRQLSDFPSQ